MADSLRNQTQKKPNHHYYTLPSILLLIFIFFVLILTTLILSNNNQSVPLFLSPALYRDLFSKSQRVSKDANFDAEKGGNRVNEGAIVSASGGENFDSFSERVSKDANFEPKTCENGEILPISRGGSRNRVNGSRVVSVSGEFDGGVENNGSRSVPSSRNGGESDGNPERESKDANFDSKRGEDGESIPISEGDNKNRVNEGRNVTISVEFGNGVGEIVNKSVPSSGNSGKIVSFQKNDNSDSDVVAEEFDVKNGESGATFPPLNGVSSNLELGSGKSVPSSGNGGKIVSIQKSESLSFGKVDGEVKGGCNLYMGKWVRDDGYPIYQPGSCPYVDEGFDCQMNGRPDSGYLKWRWKPDQCDLPRFNATDFLVRLRGKRLMLVGDSVNRNQFESMLCLLHQGLPNKTKMVEVHGYKITKGRGFYIFKFVDYNCTVEFVRSHFLVREGVRVNGQGNSNPTLSIDRIDKSSGRWKKADILIFNTGHWWVHGKISRGKNYFREGDYVYPQFDPVEAFRRALQTWAKWVDKNVNPTRQMVFYRGYSSAHFRGGDWDSGGTCNGETEPIQSGAFLDNYPTKMKIVEEVIREMKVPVALLNITRLTNFRKDGHPSIYGRVRTSPKKVSSRKQDCSHWCLPGVPDAWNELVYATLLFQQTAAENV